MLTAMAAVIGNTHTAEIMPGWKEYAILFTALVGSPGTNKSHPLSFAMQPLIDFDAEQAAIFNEAMKRYEAVSWSGWRSINDTSSLVDLSSERGLLIVSWLWH